MAAAVGVVDLARALSEPSHGRHPVVAPQKFELLQLLLEQTEFKNMLIFFPATDIASRGLDIAGVLHVIHYDGAGRIGCESKGTSSIGRQDWVP